MTDENVIKVDTTASQTALAEAVAVAPQGAVISIEEDCKQQAFEILEGQDITFDLNGHTWTSIGPFVGSTGTQSNAWRFQKGANVTIKNGTMKCIAPGVAILIQNYSNLTLDNVKLEGKSFYQYYLSCNSGHTIMKNGTVIPKGVSASFDCYYGLDEKYDDGVIVEIDDPSVVVKGKIEYGKADRIKDMNQFYQNAHIYIPKGYTAIAAPEGYEWVDISGGKQTLSPI